MKNCLTASRVSKITLNSLSEVKKGDSVNVVGLEGTSAKQLRDMGFCEFMEVKVLSCGRNMVCTVCGVKVAVSKKLAQQVVVECSA